MWGFDRGTTRLLQVQGFRANYVEVIEKLKLLHYLRFRVSGFRL